MSFLRSLASVVILLRINSDEKKFSSLKLVEQLKQTETVEHTYFKYATIYSFSSKHEITLKF